MGDTADAKDEIREISRPETLQTLRVGCLRHVSCAEARPGLSNFSCLLFHSISRRLGPVVSGAGLSAMNSGFDDNTRLLVMACLRATRSAGRKFCVMHGRTPQTQDKHARRGARGIWPSWNKLLTEDERSGKLCEIDWCCCRYIEQIVSVKGMVEDASSD
jgi:hypothetical protein